MIYQHIVLAYWTKWANRKLFDACAQLPEEDYLKARPSFFGSIHKTLNHMLVADIIWMGRFAGIDAGISSLDETLHEDFASLREAREAEDSRIIDVMTELCERDLDKDFTYRSMDGSEHSMPLGLVMTHFFTHHAHHRGQVHALLSQTPVEPPSMDLSYFLREFPIKGS